MPVYVYQCEKCKKKKEEIQKFSDAPLENCECGGHLRKQQFSGCSFQFKGKGWSADGYTKHDRVTRSMANKK